MNRIFPSLKNGVARLDESPKVGACTIMFLLIEKNYEQKDGQMRALSRHMKIH